MANPLSPMRSARFDAFELDLKAGELRRGTHTIRLQDKPFQMLVLLLESPGDVVSREEVRQKLWSSDTIVEFDHGIGTALTKLRQALGDDAAKPRYIETLPRRGYRWMAGVDWVDTSSSPGPPASESLRSPGERRPIPEEAIDSIAVLPFANLSADQENEYFSDGLAEEILNALTRVPGLKVAARTSAFSFRGREQDVRKIGGVLGVRAILEGSVRRAGTRIRVAAQLVHTGDGYHLWSERYDREMTDVFAVQDEMAKAIVEKLKPQLLRGKPVLVRPAANIEAYDACLRGRYLSTGVTPEAGARGRAAFQEAIALDPRYAPAYSGLARCLFTAVQFGLTPARETMPHVKAAALRAVELDEMESEAHALLGLVAGAFEYDWPEALRRCRLALACEPASITARQLCAQFILIPLRRFDEAIAVLEPLLTVDPLSPLPRKTLADALFMGGRDRERAIEELRRLLELDDGFWLAHFALGNIYFARGMTAEAIAAYEKGLHIAPFPPMIGRLAGLYARAGDRGRAERVLARLAGPEQANGRAKGYMFFHFACSEFDRAADYLEELIEAREPDVIWLGLDSSAARFQEVPRFRALLQKINLADVAR